MGREQKDPEGPGAGADTSSPQAVESLWRGQLRAAVKQLLSLLLTGAGLIGFVAFAGAVILWTRFEAIDVPPEQAVKAVPRDELVATGASLLLIFGFFGLLAVLATYLVDRGGRATPGVSRVLLGLVALEGIATFALAGELSLTTISIGIGFLFLVGLAVLATYDEAFAVYTDKLRPRKSETDAPLRGGNSIFSTDGRLRFSLLYPFWILALMASVGILLAMQVLDGEVADRWIAIALLGLVAGAFTLATCVEVSSSKEEDEVAQEAATGSAAGLRGTLQRAARRWRRGVSWSKGLLRPPPTPAEEKAEDEARRLARRRPHRLELKPLGVLVFLALTGLAIVVPAALMGHWWMAVSFGASFVLAAGVWRVAVLAKPGFFWLGLVIFASVPLFGTLALMARNVEDPRVQPVALIRAADGPGGSIQGLYVTEGDSRVYFANVATEGCTTEIVEGSGRLLWVPKDEVTAMSVGPLQDVRDAGRSALEMAYALTPGVETPSGALFSSEEEAAAASETTRTAAADNDGEEGSGSDGEPGPGEGAGDSDSGSDESDDGEDGGEDEAEGSGEEEDSTVEHRLESAGPAVRPSFGRGLKLVPAEAKPGEIVELRMSAPEGEGFGMRPKGYNLRLDGVRLAILRVRANRSSRAEYVKTAESGTVLPIEWATSESATADNVVQLDPSSVREVIGGRHGRYGLEVKADGSLAKPPEVELPNGDTEQLEPGLLRRAWSPTKIKFRVPEGAESGVVSVECGQLAGQPVLTVVEPPVARVAVRMRPGTARVRLDSRRSSANGELTRRWTVAGRSFGGRRVVSAALPARLSPYKVTLRVSDARGLSDTVELRVLRLPASRFPLGDEHPASRKDVEEVRGALERAIADGPPEAIELAGHADAVGGERFNVALSLNRVRNLRQQLFDSLRREDDPIPMVLRAFGESCPVVPSPGPQEVNRRVEVFLLGSGAVVKPRKPCRSARLVRTSW